MTLHKLAVLICAKEGLKKQVDIAQVKEILKVIVALEVEDFLTGHDGEDAPIAALVKAVNKEIDRPAKRKARK